MATKTLRKCLSRSSQLRPHAHCRIFTTVQTTKQPNSVASRTILPQSLRPVLSNWYLLFLLKGTVDCNILDTIPSSNNEPISVQQICTACDTQYGITYKTLRFLSSMGYTKEIKPQHFVHTDKSLDLCANGNAHHTLKYFLDADLCSAKLRYAEYLKGSTFEQLNGDQSLRDILQQSPTKRENVAHTLKEVAMTAAEPELLDTHHFDFSDATKYKKVIDLGGGIGELMFAICNQYQHINGIVFETQQCVDNASQHWSRLFGIDIHGMEHLSFVPGDLFDEKDVVQHCKDCDVIIMKRVIHDFDDEQCGKALQNIRKAMMAGSDWENKVLLICDLVLSDELNDATDLDAKLIDLEFGYLFNWKERRLSEFDALFNKHGFERIDSYPRPLANIHVTAFKPVIS